MREISSIWRLEPAIDAERCAGDACDELDRAVVVRRPQAAGDEADVCLAPRPQRRLELDGIVADDGDPRRRETE